jgi:mono/diheme cytochrome c family protein
MSHRRQIVWPSITQLLRQALMILVVSALWATLFAGFLRLTDQPPAADAAPNKSAEAEAVAAVTPTPAPTQSASATFTSTPTPTVQTTEVSLTPTSLISTPPPTGDPSPTATGTPTATPTPLPSPTSAIPAASTEESPAASADSVEVSFKNDVLPIFEQRCIKCHGGINDGKERVEEGLRLTSYEEAIAGSMNGPVVEPGDVENSYLIELIVNGKMPKKEPRLLPAQIRTITAWIEAGAPDN